MKYLAKQGSAYLVEGKIGTLKFSGNREPREPYEFDEEGAFMLRDQFGYEIEEAPQFAFWSYDMFPLCTWRDNYSYARYGPYGLQNTGIWKLYFCS